MMVIIVIQGKLLKESVRSASFLGDLELYITSVIRARMINQKSIC